jgi:hypothetical protein
MAEVTGYSILVYGGPEGYQTNRAQIYLTGANNTAWRSSDSTTPE